MIVLSHNTINTALKYVCHNHNTSPYSLTPDIYIGHVNLICGEVESAAIASCAMYRYAAYLVTIESIHSLLSL